MRRCTTHSSHASRCFAWVIGGIAFQTNIPALNAAVENGSRLVATAGLTMAEIVSSVKQASDIIGEISAAASEQSNGIGGVNTAVGELDQMTQQNAALVEQSAAAAQSLREQAERLAQVVSTFKLTSTAIAVH